MQNNDYVYQSPLARQGDMAVKELPGEVLVYDLKQHKAHCLNKSAAFIWQHCDGQTNIIQLTKLLQQEVGSPVEEDLVWYALDKLNKAELLEEKVNVPVKDGMSRRRMMRRLGALIAIPTVISLVAPEAFAQTTVTFTHRKVADGTCNTPPGPPPNAVCFTDTCCTGSKKLCQKLSPTASSCSGGPCEPLSNASDCNG